jgi:hypothetical protein
MDIRLPYEMTQDTRAPTGQWPLYSSQHKRDLRPPNQEDRISHFCKRRDQSYVASASNTELPTECTGWDEICELGLRGVAREEALGDGLAGIREENLARLRP